MTDIIHCKKLDKDAPQLARQPYPGAIGERIYREISQEAWEMWLAHQTMLINENRLSLVDPEARRFLNEELQKFFFGEGSTKPKEYTPLE